jgi:hypothetical protein
LEQNPLIGISKASIKKTFDAIFKSGRDFDGGVSDASYNSAFAIDPSFFSNPNKTLLFENEHYVSFFLFFIFRF